jgi:hypothetical protein
VHAGCTWKGQRREFEEHKGVCEFRQVFCPDCRAYYRWHEHRAHEQYVKRCELERRFTAVRYEFSLRMQEQQAEFDRRLKEQAEEFERRLRGRRGKGKGSPKGLKARSLSMDTVDMDIVGLETDTPSTMWRWDAPHSPPFQC